MGVTIHYRAFASEEQVDKVISRVKEICDDLKICYQMISEADDYWVRFFDVLISSMSRFDPKLRVELAEPRQMKGIIVSLHSESEPLWLVFHKLGGSRWFLCGFTKTQFAGSNVHKLYIAILDRVKEIVPNLIVEDESLFYETRNEKLLREILRVTERMLEEWKFRRYPGEEGV